MFLDKQTGQDTIDAYQAALDEHVAAVKLDIDAADVKPSLSWPRTSSCTSRLLLSRWRAGPG